MHYIKNAFVCFRITLYLYTVYSTYLKTLKNNSKGCEMLSVLTSWFTELPYSHLDLTVLHVVPDSVLLSCVTCGCEAAFPEDSLICQFLLDCNGLDWLLRSTDVFCSTNAGVSLPSAGGTTSLSDYRSSFLTKLLPTCWHLVRFLSPIILTFQRSSQFLSNKCHHLRSEAMKL